MGFALQLETGMRPGEVAGLCWDAVRLDATVPFVDVARSRRRDGRGVEQLEAGVKNRTSRRSIELSDDAVDLLVAQRSKVATLKLAADDWHDLNLVFPEPDGRVLNEGRARRRLASVCRAADVPVVRPHELRHTAITAMSEQGIPHDVIADVTGHASGTSLDVLGYRHRTRPTQRAAREAFNARKRRSS